MGYSRQTKRRTMVPEAIESTYGTFVPPTDAIGEHGESMYREGGTG